MQGAVPDSDFEEVVFTDFCRDSVASSVQMQKLQQDFQYKIALVEPAVTESFSPVLRPNQG